MTKSMDLRKFIEEHYKRIKPSFSPSWKDKILARVQNELKSYEEINEKKIPYVIIKIHNEEYDSLFERIKENKMLKTDRSLTYDDKEEIIQMLRIRFNDNYDHTKATEKRFLFAIIRNVIITFKRSRNPMIQTEVIENLEVKKVSQSRMICLNSIKNTNYEDTNNNNSNPNPERDSEREMNYILSSANRYGVKSLPLIRHLLIIQKDIFKNHKKIHSFPNIDFNYPSSEFIKKQYEFLKNIDDMVIDVSGYFKYYAIVNFDQRYFMIKAIEVLKKCHSVFEKELLPNLIRQNKSENQIRKDNPLLSVVAVNKNGEIIKTAYKGEGGNLGKHCEYILFEEILSENDKKNLAGGTLFVTLEPCNKRIKGKIPCSVRCIESKISQIFIGTFDPNPKVSWEGVEILESGSYSFQLKNGNLTGKDKSDIDADKWLKQEFDRKGYKATLEKNGTILKYHIGKPVTVKFFHPDLSIEIMNLNRWFIGKHSKKAFPYSKFLE